MIKYEWMKTYVIAAIVSVIILLIAIFFSMDFIIFLPFTVVLGIYSYLKFGRIKDDTTVPEDEGNFMEKHTPESLAFARNEGLRMLSTYYVDHLAEDPIDGTDFDADVLEALVKVKRKWCNPHPILGEYPPVVKKQLV